MSFELFVLLIVVVTALGFDFTRPGKLSYWFCTHLLALWALELAFWDLAVSPVVWLRFSSAVWYARAASRSGGEVAWSARWASPVGVRNPVDHAGGAQPPRVAGDLAGGDRLGDHAAQGGDERTKVGERTTVVVGEAVRLQPEQRRGGELVGLRCSASRRPGIRVPDSVNTGAVMVRQVIRTHVDSDDRKGGAATSIAGVCSRRP